MSSLFDLLSALIAMLISAALLHFGGAREAAPTDQTAPPAAEGPAKNQSAGAPESHTADEASSRHG